MESSNERRLTARCKPQLEVVRADVSAQARIERGENGLGVECSDSRPDAFERVTRGLRLTITNDVLFWSSTGGNKLYSWRDEPGRAQCLAHSLGHRAIRRR